MCSQHVSTQRLMCVTPHPRPIGVWVTSGFTIFNYSSKVLRALKMKVFSLFGAGPYLD